jgi:hypothetical protein
MTWRDDGSEVRALSALGEDTGLVPSTNTGGLILSVCNSRSWDLIFCLPQATGRNAICLCTFRQTLIHKIKINKSFLQRHILKYLHILPQRFMNFCSIHNSNETVTAETSINRQIMKLYINTVVYCSAIKKNKICGKMDEPRGISREVNSGRKPPALPY